MNHPPLDPVLRGKVYESFRATFPGDLHLQTHVFGIPIGEIPHDVLQMILSQIMQRRALETEERAALFRALTPEARKEYVKWRDANIPTLLQEMRGDAVNA